MAEVADSTPATMDSEAGSSITLTAPSENPLRAGCQGGIAQFADSEDVTLKWSFRTLEQLMAKEVSSFWDAKTLTEYLTLQWIPRGFPTFDLFNNMSLNRKGLTLCRLVPLNWCRLLSPQKRKSLRFFKITCLQFKKICLLNRTSWVSLIWTVNSVKG